MNRNNDMPDDNSLNVEWNEDHSLVIFTIQNSNRETIDEYIEANLDILRNWDQSDPIYKIQDLSHKNLNFTPYFRGRLNEVAASIKERKLNVVVAIVVGNSLTGHLMQAFGRLFATNVSHLKQRYFVGMSDAQAWIDEEKLTR